MTFSNGQPNPDFHELTHIPLSDENEEFLWKDKQYINWREWAKPILKLVKESLIDECDEGYILDSDASTVSQGIYGPINRELKTKEKNKFSK